MNYFAKVDTNFYQDNTFNNIAIYTQNKYKLQVKTSDIRSLYLFYICKSVDAIKNKKHIHLNDVSVEIDLSILQQEGNFDNITNKNFFDVIKIINKCFIAKGLLDSKCRIPERLLQKHYGDYYKNNIQIGHFDDKTEDIYNTSIGHLEDIKKRRRQIMKNISWYIKKYGEQSEQTLAMKQQLFNINNQMSDVINKTTEDIKNNKKDIIEKQEDINRTSTYIIENKEKQERRKEKEEIQNDNFEKIGHKPVTTSTPCVSCLEDKNLSIKYREKIDCMRQSIQIIKQATNFLDCDYHDIISAYACYMPLLSIEKSEQLVGYLLDKLEENTFSTSKTKDKINEIYYECKHNKTATLSALIMFVEKYSKKVIWSDNTERKQDTPNGDEFVDYLENIKDLQNFEFNKVKRFYYEIKKQNKATNINKFETMNKSNKQVEKRVVL